jgi:hypothetical protein
MARPAAAQPTQAAPPTITTNGYRLEIFQGPLLAPIHVVGVGGAYVAFAQDTEGAAVNAAAPAVRDPYSLSWFDYDISAGLSVPGFLRSRTSGDSTDFDNHGDAGPLPTINTSNFFDVNFGLTLQFGQLGVAVTGDLAQYTLSPPNSAVAGPTMDLGRWKALAAYGFFDGQLVLGGGARLLTMQIAQNNGPTLLTMTGAAPEVGALYMPTGLQWRLGAAARLAVTGGVFGSDNVTTNASGAKTVETKENPAGFVLPQDVSEPWEVEVGAAYQLGPRPLNPGWQNPHDQESKIRQRIRDSRAERALLHQAELSSLAPDARAARQKEIAIDEAAQRALEDTELDAESKLLYAQRQARYENWPREKILLLASVLMTGPTSSAVSLQGFVDQRVETVGRKVTVTPRFGVEGEPLRDLMTVRAGTYVEPSRYADGTPRQHFTFGADVRLFPIDFWGLLPSATLKVAFMVDLAPRYENYGIGIGNWH